MGCGCAWLFPFSIVCLPFTRVFHSIFMAAHAHCWIKILPYIRVYWKSFLKTKSKGIPSSKNISKVSWSPSHYCESRVHQEILSNLQHSSPMQNKIKIKVKSMQLQIKNQNYAIKKLTHQSHVCLKSIINHRHTKNWNTNLMQKWNEIK